MTPTLGVKDSVTFSHCDLDASVTDLLSDILERLSIMDTGV